MVQQDKPKRNDLVGDVLERPSSRISGTIVLIALGNNRRAHRDAPLQNALAE
jgi:hypothetical protein